MTNKFLLAVWLISLLVAMVARADDEIGSVEYQYQAAVALDGALGKQLDWGLTQTVYFDENYRMYAYTPQVSLTWTATRRLSLTAGYRLARVEEEGAIWFRQRLFASGTFSLPIDDWRLNYRLRWSGDWRDPDEGGMRYRAYLRNRIQVRYAGLEHLTPYGSVEVAHRLDEGRTSSGVDRTGYRLGSEVDIAQHQSLDLWGRLTVYANNNPDVYTFGLEYAYSFK